MLTKTHKHSDKALLRKTMKKTAVSTKNLTPSPEMKVRSPNQCTNLTHPTILDKLSAYLKSVAECLELMR